ncbi:hypothetical protein ABZ543_12965 [Streptomyces roseifaciens]
MTTPSPFPYKRPGVYIKESLKPLPIPVVAPGTAIATFVGVHNTGPTVPVKLTAWDQFVALYGGFGSGLDYLPFQVYSYFANGGSQAWVLRAVPDNAVAATKTFQNQPKTFVSPIQPSPPGTPPVGTGTAPAKVMGVALADAPPPNPDQTNFAIKWTALGTAPDAYQVVCTATGSTTGAAQTVWILGTDQPKAAFGGLKPGGTYSVVVTGYKGTTAGVASDALAVTMVAGYQPVDAMKISARGKGAYGNKIWIEITAAWSKPRFHLFVKQGDTAATAQTVETWQDMSLVPSDPRYVVSVMNSSTSGSNMVSIENLLPPATETPGTSQTPDETWLPQYTLPNTPVALAGGSDGTGVANLPQALENSFSSINDVLLVNLCGRDKDATNYPDGIPLPAAITAAVTWIEKRGGAFLVMDAPSAPPPTTPDQAVSKYQNLLPVAQGGGGQYPSSSYCAFYAPWVQVTDPAGQSVSSTRVLPPGGAVMGRFAKADADVGPNRAPAGVSYALVGAVGVQQLFTLSQLDTLNEIGANIVRPVPQAGYCIMGARTLRRGMPDRYVSVRRMLTYLTSLLEQVTRFAVFEPNGPGLWQKVAALVTQQLQQVTQAGQLQSTLPEEAFFVICDETNNTPQTVANGEIHVSVGVALATPAEFIIIEISQYQGNVTQTRNSLEQPVS